MARQINQLWIEVQEEEGTCSVATEQVNEKARTKTQGYKLQELEPKDVSYKSNAFQWKTVALLLLLLEFMVQQSVECL